MALIIFLLILAGFYFFIRGLWLGGWALFAYVMLSLPYLIIASSMMESS